MSKYWFWLHVILVHSTLTPGCPTLYVTTLVFSFPPTPSDISNDGEGVEKELKKNCVWISVVLVSVIVCNWLIPYMSSGKEKVDWWKICDSHDPNYNTVQHCVQHTVVLLSVIVCKWLIPYMTYYMSQEKGKSWLVKNLITSRPSSFCCLFYNWIKKGSSRG